MNIGKCGFFMRKDYGQIILFGMISIIILWIMKYVLPYFLPFAVALITVVPLHASFIRKGRADKKGRGIMAGGIVFILLLVIALVFVGLGTFMMSKAQTLIGNLGRVEQASFEVYVKEDILQPDGTGNYAVWLNGAGELLELQKDTKIETIITDWTGTASIKNLPLGTYYVKEVKAGNGTFLLNPEVKDFYQFTRDDVKLIDYQTHDQIKNIPVAV